MPGSLKDRGRALALPTRELRPPPGPHPSAPPNPTEGDPSPPFLRLLSQIN